MTTEQTLADELSLGKIITKKVKLTSAQVKALRATPIQLVAGLPGRMIQFVGATLMLDYAGTNGFTETADNLAIRYTDGSGVLVSQAIETTGFIDQTADTITTAFPKIDAIATRASATGAPLVLHNTGDGEIAGNAGADNTVTVAISYIVHDLS